MSDNTVSILAFTFLSLLGVLSISREIWPLYFIKKVKGQKNRTKIRPFYIISFFSLLGGALGFGLWNNANQNNTQDLLQGTLDTSVAQGKLLQNDIRSLRDSLNQFVKVDSSNVFVKNGGTYVNVKANQIGFQFSDVHNSNIENNNAIFKDTSK